MIKGIIFDWVGTLYERNRGPYFFSEEVLGKVSEKYKLGLVTLAGGGLEARKKQIRESGLEKYFNQIVMAMEKGETQYQECTDKLGLATNEIVVVDDQVRRLVSAKRIGCKTAWIKNGEYENDVPESGEEPDWRLSSVKELSQILGE